jgi:hypothetical protein
MGALSAAKASPPANDSSAVIITALALVQRDRFFILFSFYCSILNGTDATII